jgi:hypothetical protein
MLGTRQRDAPHRDQREAGRRVAIMRAGPDQGLALRGQQGRVGRARRDRLLSRRRRTGGWRNAGHVSVPRRDTRLRDIARTAASTEPHDRSGADTRADRFAGAVDHRVFVVQDGCDVRSGEDCAELERELIRVCVRREVGGGMRVAGGLQ